AHRLVTDGLRALRGELGHERALCPALARRASSTGTVDAARRLANACRAGMDPRHRFRRAPRMLPPERGPRPGSRINGALERIEVERMWRRLLAAETPGMSREALQLVPIIALGSIAAFPAHPQNVASSDSEVVESRHSETTDTQLEERSARDWGLETEEWTRYLDLMQGPLGVYSPGLDPLTALGIE